MSQIDRERRKSISYKGGINATVCLSGNKLKDTNYLNGERQLYLKHKQDFWPSTSSLKFQGNEQYIE